jgi:uncharacterized protein DUF1552
MTNLLSRRTVLRGAFQGAVVSLGLPFLDCFLDSNGTALASNGGPLPPIFGTWFQHLGLEPGMWQPTTVGPNYENNSQLKVLEPFRTRTNIYSGMKYFLDGRPSESHVTGAQIAATGGIPNGTISGPSIDSVISGVISKNTRFRSLEVSLSGSKATVSQRSGTAPNPSESSPTALYARIFGSGFTDPNAVEFTPDPINLARQSALSAVTDQRQAVMRALGSADRARLDEYFSALREIEQQIALNLEKPAPLEACTVPGAAGEAVSGTVLEDVSANSKLFAGLLAHAIACDQSRVFNVMVGSLGLRKSGSSYTWHTATHEEPIDEALGYQKEVFEFTRYTNRVFADFLTTLATAREGAGTLLDRMLILWQTEHSYARIHGLDDLPILTVGNAGGRIKTGIHVRASGEPAARVGLTVQQAFGVPVQAWGELSNTTNKTITEVL